jgi:hypothetical protein
MIATQKLSNLQLELIKVFSYQLNDAQLFEIKDILAKYFAEKATQEMDNLWNENSWNNKTMDNWANEHLRTPSN